LAALTAVNVRALAASDTVSKLTAIKAVMIH
jgi:hypothetical protein